MTPPAMVPAFEVFPGAVLELDAGAVLELSGEDDDLNARETRDHTAQTINSRRGRRGEAEGRV